MKTPAGLMRCALIVLVGLAVAAPGDAEKEGKKQPNPYKEVAGKAGGISDPRAVYELDAVEICGKLFDLSGEQKTALAALDDQREQECREAASKINEAYADKVREVLTEEQKGQYDKILAALNQYRATVRVAMDEFRAVAGTEGFGKAASGHVDASPELVKLLALTDDQKGQIKAAYMERDRIRHEAEQSIQKPADKNDKAAKEQYEQARKAADEKARAAFKDKVNAALTPEQREQLEKLRAAAETMNEKIEQAKDAYKQAIKQAFGLE